MKFFDLSTLIFLVAAVIIFLQLRGVLGRRTGNEKPPFDPFAGSRRDKLVDAANDGNVVTLPRRKPEAPVTDFAAIDAVAPAGSELNTGLRAISQADPSFSPDSFMAGARTAYEMIVTAFADGDRKALKGLLSKEVFDGFQNAINEREMRGEKVEMKFVGISRSEYADAEMKGSEASITLKLVSQLISATLGKDGQVIEGDRQAVTDVRDIWTFSRDTRSRDPNWKLTATETED